jgi:hypothetical protein
VYIVNTFVAQAATKGHNVPRMATLKIFLGEQPSTSACPETLELLQLGSLAPLVGQNLRAGQTYGSAKLSIRQKPCVLSNRTGTAIGPDCWDLTRRISCQ